MNKIIISAILATLIVIIVNAIQVATAGPVNPFALKRDSTIFLVALGIIYLLVNKGRFK